MENMKKGILIGALAAGVTVGASAAEAAVVTVANGEALADAIVAANSDSTVRVIRCAKVGGCDVTGTLPTYTGAHPLLIDGVFSTVDATGITDVDAFASVGGGRLTVMRLTFVGGMTGIYVEVPAEKIGSQWVDLKRVTVRDSHLHGVYINDHNYSIASVRLNIAYSKFLDNGFGVKDQDGVRVNETSKGMAKVTVTGSTFSGNSGDGMSVNERGGGRVSATLTKSHFLDNGSDPNNLNNPEDGFDIDEFGPGDVWLTVSGGRFKRNFDDGLDIDESQGGSIYAEIDGARVSMNLDLGLAFDESKGGDSVVAITDSVVINNDGGTGFDLVGIQDDGGTGRITLEDVDIGDWTLRGMQMMP